MNELANRAKWLRENHVVKAKVVKAPEQKKPTVNEDVKTK